MNPSPIKIDVFISSFIDEIHLSIFIFHHEGCHLHITQINIEYINYPLMIKHEQVTIKLKIKTLTLRRWKIQTFVH